MHNTKQKKNKLAAEKSPYLLQHADNPVDWHPWGKEAFDKARKEDKPIFLSIGYSTCHWCHVMEHESFEDVEIAGFLNEHFISIKVDREERPDIDGIYMSAVQAISGRGGWPLSIFITADQKPFFGGTYFPPRAKWGSPGFLDVLRSIDNSWKNNRKQLIASGNQLTELLRESVNTGNNNRAGVSPAVLDEARQRFEASFDKRFGGFGTSPKFPTSHNLDFLMRVWHSERNQQILDIVQKTLRSMAEGGMYDHLGGGFHRYSTDHMWQIPHFEKMLYDQATLTRTYLEAYQITKDTYYADVARDILIYVLRDLRDPKGGFYSAEDADSLDPDEFSGKSVETTLSIEKKEGAFYIWRYSEIKKILNAQQFEAFYNRYAIREGGNAHSDPHNEFTGKNILFALQSPAEVAVKIKKTEEQTSALLKEAREVLLSKRNERPKPHLDDKVIVDWNGLMISSLAYASRVLDTQEYLTAAEEAAQFIIKNLIDKDGRLYHRYRDNDVDVLGTIEDYAFFVDGLIELYQASFKEEYLQTALRLSEKMIQLFWDDENGGFYFTADDAEELLLRQKEVYDGATPSGNSVAANNLIKLYHFTFEEKWETYFTKQIDHFAPQLNRNPNAYTKMLMAYQFAQGPSQEIVIAGEREDALFRQYIQETASHFIPFSVILLRSKKNAKDMVKLAEYLKEQKPIDNKATVYLCENHVCKLPVNDFYRFKKLIEGIVKEP